MYDKLLNIVLRNTSSLISLHFHQANHSIDNLFIQGLTLFNNSNDVFNKLLLWIRKLKTFNVPGIDQSINIPFNIRFSIPFSHHNSIWFRQFKDKVSTKFSVNILPAYSTYPNLKKTFM